MAHLDFQTEVLDRSRDVPIVVDFWASWCGPCRTLGPIIEQLAEEANGRWELVKIDTESQPNIARDYNVMSIPSVKMFHGGAVVAEFVGALPAEMIREWLDKNLPDSVGEEPTPLLDGPERPFDPANAEKLEAYVEAHPDAANARIRLAQSLVTKDPGRARELAASVPDDPENTADIGSLADLVEATATADGPCATDFEHAKQSFEQGDLDATLEHLIDAAIRDKDCADALARRAAIALFRALGQNHELTRKHRRRLSMALHA